jgi:hypothetical protein
VKAFAAVLLVIIGLTGCSSKFNSAPLQPTGPTNPTNSYAFNGGAIAGFHGNVSERTTALKFSLIPLVYAQTTTILLSGTYTGYGLYTPTGASAPVAFPVYGVGTLLPVCGGLGQTAHRVLRQLPVARWIPAKPSPSRQRQPHCWQFFPGRCDGGWDSWPACGLCGCSYLRELIHE